MNIVDFLKDLIAPKKCYSCKKEWYFFCSECFKKSNTHSPFCYICKKPSDNFEIHKNCHLVSSFSRIMVFWRYKDYYLQKLIKDGKFYGKKEVYKDVWKYLSEFFLEHYSLDKKQEYIIVAAPMHFFRRWKRGYNHSDVLAKEVAKNLGIVYYKNLIVKKQYTKQQSHLSREERLINVRGAFRVHEKYKEILSWKTIILIDDVVSTGSTLWEIANLLKIRKVKDIIWLVIASD